MRIIKLLIKIAVVLCIAYILYVVALAKLIKAPENFPAPYRLTIESGQTLFSVSNELHKDNVIRSPRIFEILMVVLGSEKNISEGEYYFGEPSSVLTVAMRISGKEFGISRQKITFPEGFTNKEMTARFKTLFPNFDIELFSQLIKNEEGYLFPDTYSFFPSVEPNVAVTALKQNFERKIAPLRDDIEKTGHSLSDIIIMASIVEKEANGPEDRAVVAGILWQRLSQNMPLQVDAPFLYILGKESSELTKEDLAIKSPYNTYINTGLPPAPINNPGLAAIKAAISPQASGHLYYLHDKEGNIHYANTYEEHKKNIENYLK
jgi:UPF0755 protein